jgi:hypothetical protein
MSAAELVSAGPRVYHGYMATAVKRLDLAVGELVEIAGRRYEVVPDREGGVTIEPPITPAAQLHARRGTKPASTEDFERLSADVPHDDEG